MNKKKNDDNINRYRQTGSHDQPPDCGSLSTCTQRERIPFFCLNAQNMTIVILIMRALALFQLYCLLLLDYCCKICNWLTTTFPFLFSSSSIAVVLQGDQRIATAKLAASAHHKFTEFVLYVESKSESGSASAYPSSFGSPLQVSSATYPTNQPTPDVGTFQVLCSSECFWYFVAS